MTALRNTSVCWVLVSILLLGCAAPNEPLTHNDPSRYTVAANVPWSAPEGFDLSMDIYTPRSGKASYPVLVMFHGGGWLITAQRRPGGFDIDWVLAMRPQQTVVFYMGLSLLGDITQGLLGRGMPGSTPFAVVSKATQPDQLLITGTLSDIEAACHGKAIPSPALLIMGHSVSHIREQPALVQECHQRILLNRETGTKPVGSDLA